MTGKQISILIFVALIGIIVLGMGLLAFGLSVIPVLQDSDSNIDVGMDPTMVFEPQQASPEVPLNATVSSTPVSSGVLETSEVIEATPSPTFEPPIGYKEYRDSVAGVSIYIPENWTVTGVIPGQYAIFQSYPDDKYTGGEARESSDTKCDLNIHPIKTRMTDLIQQWEADSSTIIISDQEIILKSGLIGRQVIRESMGSSVSLVTEINRRAISLTCFGDFTPVDDIAQTLSGFEPVIRSPIYQSSEGFKHYMDTETGVTIDMPWHWIVTGIVPGQRATLQSFPQDKYIGGEALETGDTKCDLFIRSDIRADDFISQMKSNEAITILTEQELILNSNQNGTRIELNSLGPSILFVTEINAHTVVLTCYGDFAIVDAIAATLDADG